MAKKKKTIVYDKSEKASITNLTYEGKVCIKTVYDGVVISKKEIKNNGTNNLLNGICFWLADNKLTNTNVYKPHYMACSNNTNQSAYDKSSSTFGDNLIKGSIVPITSAITDTSNHKIVYTAVIPGTAFSGAGDITHIGLFGDNLAEWLLAYINVNIDKPDSKTSLIIEWTVTLSNKGEISNG